MTLAWTEYKTGDLRAASLHANEALRLGWRDPVAVHRAEVIARAAGDVALAQRVTALQAR